jgi:drug/metabolite transporter (DMT)-like permease
MEGFTIALALVDAIPVLSFGVSMVIIASRFPSPLFMIGAILSVLGGCCKVAWKLVLGITRKDLRWLNKPFVPMMAGGFLLLLISVLLNITAINWAGVGAAIIGLPSILFFIAWIGLMGFMGWFRKYKFSNDDAHSNWTAQIINAIGQTCLLIGILFAS